jgi:hypothetical protein
VARSKRLLLGFIGSGELSPKNIKPQLDDLTEGKEVTFILPATKEHFTDSLAAVADYADDNKIDFEVVTDDTTSKSKGLKDLAADASAKNKAASSVASAIVDLLEESSDDARLIVFWPGEDDATDDDHEAIEAADDKDVSAYDICDALSLFNLSDPGGASPASDDRGQEDEKPSRRSRSRDDDDDKGNDGPDDIPDDEELEAMGLVALKKLAVDHKLVDDVDELKGKRATSVVKLLQEARDNAPGSGDVTGAQDSDDRGQDDAGDDDGDAAGVDIPEHIQLTPATTKALRAAAGDFVEAVLTAFVVEARKPKTAGRPRADGTPAVPVSDEEKNRPKRRVGRPNKDDDSAPSSRRSSSSEGSTSRSSRSRRSADD